MAKAVAMPSDRAKTLRVYRVCGAKETVESSVPASLPEPGVLDPTLARFGPTTPARAGRLADASVDWTDMRSAPASDRNGTSKKKACVVFPV
jgi:hypothetical protein